MQRRDFLKLMGVGAAAGMMPSWMGTAAPGGADRPNVLVMIADDLGSGDVSCLLRQSIKTPNIDRLAQKGVKFVEGYVSAPLCAPSRAGFFSGRYQQRFGFENNADGIPENVELMPAAFRKAGYTTCLLGKWHSAGVPPRERGFDEFLGYFGPFLNYQQPILTHNGKQETHQEYSSDLFAREAERYLEQHLDKPFFLTVAFNAPHIERVLVQATEIKASFDAARAQGKVYDIPKVPMARPGEADKYQSQFPGDRARADTVATIVALDQAIGRVLDKLEKTGLDRRTVVFLFSDNGGHPENRSENLPLSEYKWSMYEGGVRVPFFAAYPGAFPAGLEYRHPVSSMDIYPTCAALAGVTAADKLDGVNLAPYLRGEKTGAPHEALCWRMGTDCAIREGQWKMVFSTGAANGAGPAAKLFDMTRDIEEKNDLASQHPDVVSTLRARWDAWNAEMPPRQSPLGKKGKGKGKGKKKKAA